jgi:hypothetical protein
LQGRRRPGKQSVVSPSIPPFRWSHPVRSQQRLRRRRTETRRCRTRLTLRRPARLGSLRRSGSVPGRMRRRTGTTFSSETKAERDDADGCGSNLPRRWAREPETNRVSLPSFRARRRSLQGSLHRRMKMAIIHLQKRPNTGALTTLVPLLNDVAH